VLNGAKEMKRKIVIIGLRLRKQQKAAIRDGSMAGAITQNPVGIVTRRSRRPVKALKGEKLPKIIDTGFYWYDRRTSTSEDRCGSFTTDHGRMRGPSTSVGPSSFPVGKHAKLLCYRLQNKMERHQPDTKGIPWSSCFCVRNPLPALRATAPCSNPDSSM